MDHPRPDPAPASGRDPLETLRRASAADPPAVPSHRLWTSPWLARRDALAELLGVSPRVVAGCAVGGIVLAVLAVIVAVVAWWPAGTGAEREPAAVPRAGDATIPFASGTTVPARLVVHAAGAVGRPGVYELPAGARVADLVEAAGGLAADADTDRVNLAEPVADGGRVFVPRRGEDPPPVVGGATPSGGAHGGSGAGLGGGATPSGPIRLNEATEAELEELPGIGPATAAAIVAHRQTNGPFRTVDELLDVRGIGPAKLEQIRPHVVVP